jgi:serine/threonine protein kinase
MSAEQAGASDRDGLGREDPTSPETGETQFNTRTIGPKEAPPGMVIGSYHLLQLIGHGGMGEVWLAEQKQPVRRRVAVKLIKAGMDTREVGSAVRIRTAGAGADGPSGHRQGVRRRFDGTGPAVLRDGVRHRRSHHRLLRQAQAD